MNRKLAAILVLATVIVGVVAAAIVLGPQPGPSPRYDVSISVDGTRTVGQNLHVRVSVRDRLGHSTTQTLTYLSLGIGTAYEIRTVDSCDDHWGRANVWNLSGLDLSAGRSFTIDVVPLAATESIFSAHVWFPKGALSAVRFETGGVVDVYTVAISGLASARILTNWPFEVSVSLQGDPLSNNTFRLMVTVRGAHSANPPPDLSFVSLEKGSDLLRVDTPDSGDDPWRLPYVWNASELNMSAGIEFSLDLTPTAAGNFTSEGRIWSPLTEWNTVRFNQSGFVENSESIRVWGSAVFDLSVPSQIAGQSASGVLLPPMESAPSTTASGLDESGLQANVASCDAYSLVCEISLQIAGAGRANPEQTEGGLICPDETRQESCASLPWLPGCSFRKP